MQILNLFQTSAIVLLSFLINLYGSCVTRIELPNQVTTQKVEKMIHLQLAEGDSLAQIEQFFKKNNLGYDYNEYDNSYNSIIRDVSPYPLIDQAIVIEIFLNDKKEFVRAEVHDSFTGL